MDLVAALQVFRRVGELSSFTAAAEQLGLPKASVSTTVRRLEAHLGTRLLHRTTRRVQLTPDGQVFLERCRDLLEDVDDLRGLFRPEGMALRGRLRVDMPIPVARDVVLPRLAEFTAAHPGLELELSSTDRRVDLVSEGFDCVLRVGSLADSSLIARPLGHYRMVNCASPAYLAEHGMPWTPADLAAHRLVHHVTTSGARPAGFEYLDETDPLAPLTRFVPMAGGLTVNDADSYQQACLAGFGIIQVPEAGVAEHLESGRLIAVLDDFRPAPMPVSLLYPHRRHLPRRVQVFMNWLAGVMAPRLQA
ncbi:MAG TPA: LysR family transcriptional regulator [Burkholderiaceae bacterium]|nr:LysR family transcriptional regulator [Burkholderiaceae bacterium]